LEFQLLAEAAKLQAEASMKQAEAATIQAEAMKLQAENEKRRLEMFSQVLNTPCTLEMDTIAQADLLFGSH
jgi:hypothetical protein